MTSSEGFQHCFNTISKFVCCGFHMKKNAAFTFIFFAVLKWNECLSFQTLLEVPFEISFQMLLELEANWLDRNANELEFELSKGQLISKCLFGVFNSPKKQTKTIQLEVPNSKVKFFLISPVPPALKSRACAYNIQERYTTSNYF